jgi:hypothetical protein
MTLEEEIRWMEMQRRERKRLKKERKIENQRKRREEEQRRRERQDPAKQKGGNIEAEEKEERRDLKSVLRKKRPREEDEALGSPAKKQKTSVPNPQHQTTAIGGQVPVLPPRSKKTPLPQMQDPTRNKTPLFVRRALAKYYLTHPRMSMEEENAWADHQKEERVARNLRKKAGGRRRGGCCRGSW